MRLYERTAHDLHEMLVNKKVSAKEITEDVLKRLEETEPSVRAYLAKDAGAALAQAEAADKKIASGEKISFLTGLPGAVKDNICTKGMTTTCASRILEHFNPPYDATAVEKLKANNAVILGKANMDEFAMGGSTEHSGFYPTHNPHALDRVPGGSSGGSAAAVAAGSAIWALGSDTGGSIRQPASFCGVVGMKPTYGRVSRYGLVAYASSLDQIGPVARDVTDCAHILTAIAGRDPMDSTSGATEVPDYAAALREDVKGLKIGIPKEYFIDGMDKEVETVVRSAVQKFADFGAEVTEISLPHTPYAIAAYYLLAPAEAATNLERYDGVSYGERVDGADIVELMTNTRTAKFGAEVKRRIMIGNYALSAGYYDAYYLKALKVRTLVAQDYADAFQKVDLIMAPTAPTPAFKIGELTADPLQMYLQDVCTVPLNLAGLPGISIPCGYGGTGLPIGLQIIGRALDEATILRAAYTYEQSAGFPNRLPQVGGANK